MKKTALLICLCLVSGHLMFGQDSETIDLYQSPFQFTFMFPPLSTNGVRNAETEVNASLNLFTGYTGAIDGFELGSFLNINRYHMHGFQGSGFLNIVGGEVSGVQIAGFGNTTGGSTRGAQLSGFFNIAGTYESGIQIGGFLNLAGSGDINVQASGFCNVAENVKAAQIGGFLNVAEHVKGFQGAGFINVAGYVDGVQAAGFINICDSINGIPLGVINIVRHNGYRHFVVSMSESQYINLSYRMGVRKFYTILSFGKLSGPGSRWIYGYGIGSEFDVRENIYMNIELTSGQELWIADSRADWPLQVDRLNLLNQGRVLFNFRRGEKISLFAGPTLNVAVSEASPYIGDMPYYEIGPNWAVYDRTHGSNEINVKIWFGITGGIRL
jgi:hypothetical protein